MKLAPNFRPKATLQTKASRMFRKRKSAIQYEDL